MVVIGFGGGFLASGGSEASLRAFAPRLAFSREREGGRGGVGGYLGKSIKVRCSLRTSRGLCICRGNALGKGEWRQKGVT